MNDDLSRARPPRGCGQARAAKKVLADPPSRRQRRPQTPETASRLPAALGLPCRAPPAYPATALEPWPDSSSREWVTALQLQKLRRDYIRGLRAPRAALIAHSRRAPCPSNSVRAAFSRQLCFRREPAAACEWAVALRPKRRVAAAPPPEPAPMHYRRA